MTLPKAIAVVAQGSTPSTLQEVLERYRGTLMNQANMQSLKAELQAVMHQWVAEGHLSEVPPIWVTHRLATPGVANVVDEDGLRALVAEKIAVPSKFLATMTTDQLLASLRLWDWEVV